MKSLIQKEKNMKPVILFLTFLFPTTFLSCAEKTELMEQLELPRLVLL